MCLIICPTEINGDQNVAIAIVAELWEACDMLVNANICKHGSWEELDS